MTEGMTADIVGMKEEDPKYFDSMKEAFTKAIPEVSANGKMPDSIFVFLFYSRSNLNV